MKPHALVLALSAVTAAPATAQTVGDRYGYDRPAYVAPSAYGAPFASQQGQPAVGRTLTWANKATYSAQAPAYDNRYQPNNYQPAPYQQQQYAPPSRYNGQAPYAQPQPYPQPQPLQAPQRQAYAPQYAQPYEPARQASASYGQAQEARSYPPQPTYYEPAPQPQQAPQRQAYAQPYEPMGQQAPRYEQLQRQPAPAYPQPAPYSEPQRQAYAPPPESMRPQAPRYDQPQRQPAPSYVQPTPYSAPQPPPYAESQAPRFEPTTYIPPSRGPTTYVPAEHPAMIPAPQTPERNGARVEMGYELSGGPPQPVQAAPERPRAQPTPPPVMRIPAARPQGLVPPPARMAQAQPAGEKSEVHYYSLHRAYGLTPDAIPAPDPRQNMVLIGPGDSGSGPKGATDKDDDNASEKPF